MLLLQLVTARLIFSPHRKNKRRFYRVILLQEYDGMTILSEVGQFFVLLLQLVTARLIFSPHRKNKRRFYRVILLQEYDGMTILSEVVFQMVNSFACNIMLCSFVSCRIGCVGRLCMSLHFQFVTEMITLVQVVRQ